ncbi:MAG TPA: molybdate ABC transporter substrate-binding protein [Solirubrobacteraceae bacterium]|nr:molybdate ABC transporter substrate-binding protein [Solirubrobacteraceae bacterium]
MTTIMPRPRALLAVLIALAVALTVASCGDDDESSATTSGSGQIVVSAATSLKKALTTYGDRFEGATVRLSFAGSDELAAQIRQGIEPDVFASANTKLPDQLFREGLVEQPVTFATNELVLAVPAGSTKIASLDDLSARGVTLAIGAEGVPVGDYTRKVLGGLPAAKSKAVLASVRSNEPDVGGIVGKLTQGAVDAGFVYRSDVQGAGGKLTAIELPDELKPTVEYGVAIVKDARNPVGGKAFVDGLLQGPGAQALKDNGFGVPGRT